MLTHTSPTSPAASREPWLSDSLCGEAAVDSWFDPAVPVSPEVGAWAAPASGLRTVWITVVGISSWSPAARSELMETVFAKLWWDARTEAPETAKERAVWPSGAAGLRDPPLARPSRRGASAGRRGSGR